VDERTEEAVVVVRRRPRWRRIAFALLALLLVALLVLWLMRKQIAADYIDRELARRGIHATYRVKHLGVMSQRIEDVVLGDPADPDLVARSVELRLSWGFRRPRVVLVTGRGVRLKGRLVNGALRFGEVDRLFPPSGKGGPFRLPNQNVDIADAILRLDTPAGRLGVAIEGRGNLAGGFEGRASLASRRLAFSGCNVARPIAHWQVSTEALRPRFVGPARFDSLGCDGNLLVRQGRLRLDSVLTPGLDGWKGHADVAAAEGRAGLHQVGAFKGVLRFQGNAVETRGTADMAAASVRTSGFAAGPTRLAGDYALRPRDGELRFAGEGSARAVAPPPGIGSAITSALAATRATPIAAVGAAWSKALSAALRRFDARADIRLLVRGPRGGVRFSGVTANAASGARLVLGGGDGVSYSWPNGAVRLDGQAAFSGGGLPDVRMTLSQPRARGPITGLVHIDPYSAGTSRLARADIRFAAAPDGSTSVDTVATIDGPLENGRVSRLVLPVRGRLLAGGGFVFGAKCETVSFRALQIGSLRLDAARLPLCPTGTGLLWRRGGRDEGGATIAAPRLSGTLGRSPVEIAAGRLRVALAGPSFSASDLAVRFGPADAPNRIALQSFSGRFERGGAAGTYAGLSGKLTTVPLVLSKGEGPWRLAGGALSMSGRIVVADEQDPPRFYPLASPDFRFTLGGNDIRAAGRLVEPTTGTLVANVAIAHALDGGAGNAVIDVPGLRFTPDFQPEKITRLTTGVVALVDGTLAGRGDIAWGPVGTRSTGTFSTTNMNLAASFGPVEKLTTTIRFTDLLGLASAPHQEASVGAVRTGIDVFDGRVRYQILPELKVRVEGAEWPFAGGSLTLDDTILDFSRPAQKRLTFRVAGMDAARFVQQMEFSNISATGTFDGIVPMIFDERGGRIVGGHLEARAPGGNLSYVGELSDKQLGAYGKLAFDALKALRYSRLIVDLDGALDGEFVAGIKLDGIARDPALTQVPGGGIRGMIANRALGQLAKIPFRFNIRVSGPFRALIGITRSFEDPTNLLQSVLPSMLGDKPPAPAPAPPKTVQPKESEPVR